MSNRIGKFQLSAVLFRQSHYEEMAAIQKDMAVLHIESNFCTQKAIVFAVHQAFDDVIEGAIIPSYEVVIEKLHDGSIASVTFKRITE